MNVQDLTNILKRFYSKVLVSLFPSRDHMPFLQRITIWEFESLPGKCKCVHMKMEKNTSCVSPRGCCLRYHLIIECILISEFLRVKPGDNKYLLLFQKSNIPQIKQAFLISHYIQCRVSDCQLQHKNRGEIWWLFWTRVKVFETQSYKSQFNDPTI